LQKHISVLETELFWNSSENCCCRGVRFIVSQLTYHALQCNWSQQCCPKTFICTVFFSATVFLIIFVWYSVRILGHKWIYSFLKYVVWLLSHRISCNNVFRKESKITDARTLQSLHSLLWILWSPNLLPSSVRHSLAQTFINSWSRYIDRWSAGLWHWKG
jgi:hypothetical protein